MQSMLRSARPGSRRGALLAVCLACAGVASGAWAGDTPQAPAKAPDPAGARSHPRPSHYAPDRFAGRAGLNYRLFWGIDSISVRLVESGELVRFTYRVLDPSKAHVLNDKQAQATLDDPKAGVSLLVPTMEKVGQLRQTSAPETGRSYWVTFSNKGRRVKRGDRVDVVIGQFKANNLVVD
jgi:hypothetical protein